MVWPGKTLDKRPIRSKNERVIDYSLFLLIIPKMEQDEEWFGLVSSFDAECGIGAAVHGE